MASASKYSYPNNKTNPLSGDGLKLRLNLIGAAFFFLFGVIVARLFYVSYYHPMLPDARLINSQHAGIISDASLKDMTAGNTLGTKRATIIDRNGQTLATSLPVVQIYANPQEITNPWNVAYKLHSILPKLDKKELVSRLLERKRQFVYVARNVSQQQEVAINNLGIPGVYFLPSEQRFYPLGRTAAHILGAVDIDDQGIAGIEKFFNKRLAEDHTPLKLSIDTRIQSLVHDILEQSADTYQTKKACAIVLDVHTGEIIALVSLPDYEMDNFAHASEDAHFNRAVTGLYEPGSTFKLQTIAMGLATGTIHLWDNFSSTPIHIDHFHIQDMATDHFPPWLSLPQIMAFSSNPASAHIALDVGEEKQEEWLQKMGFFSPVDIELPETARPLLPHRWSYTTTMTVGFGHGIAESPLAIVQGFAPTVNGGYFVKPTLTYHDPSQPLPVSQRVMSEKLSKLLCKLLRLDVTTGTGKSAEVAGYFVGGKTGTAEKTGQTGHYLKHSNISSFTGVFPMNNPRYSVYVMFDEPQGTPQTHGWTTASWNAAPTTANMIARIGPMLGILPDLDHLQRIDKQLSLPLHPAAPKGVIPLGPERDPGEAHLQKIQEERHKHMLPFQREKYINNGRLQ